MSKTHLVKESPKSAHNRVVFVRNSYFQLRWNTPFGERFVGFLLLANPYE